MKRIKYLMLLPTLYILVLTGIFLTAYASPSPRDEYAVGGEIIPVNPTPYLLSPVLLAAVTAIIIFIAASILVEGFPVKIVIENR